MWQSKIPQMCLDQNDLEDLVEAIHDSSPVSGLTHNFYRYPARFSPSFARATISAFTEPGDWVLDPFVGGGTTLVEALVAGRNALGSDISSLATFICKAKTLIFDEEEIKTLQYWTQNLRETINMHASTFHFPSYAGAGYYRNISNRDTWRIRKAIEQALASTTNLESEKAQMFTRCTILKTAQWALDGRKTLPNIPHFREELAKQARVMLSAAENFRERIKHNDMGFCPEAICLNRSASDLKSESTVARAIPPKLIVTSPPYPGIHVIYHRWQVDGRKETPAPFWIANQLDGRGPSYYTMGSRHCPELRTYFKTLETNFRSIASLCGPETRLVQMLAFSEPDWQLPRYLEIMQACGFQEIHPWGAASDQDGRIWRTVPNRKWYTRKIGCTSSSREVVLVHMKP